MIELTMPLELLAFVWPGGTEWIILLILGLLIFGRRLPEVGRSLGRGIVEFKKGVKGIDDEIEDASSEKSRRIEEKERPRLDQPEATREKARMEAIAREKTGAAVSEDPNPYAAPDDQTEQER